MIAKLTYLALCLAVIVGLSACSTTKTGSLCPLGFFNPDPGWQERLTRAEKEYLVTLNESGEEICGWRPAGR